MNSRILLVTLFLGMSCCYCPAQDKSKTDWEAEYEKLLKANPAVRKKVESGRASKEDVISWLKNQRGVSKKSNSKPNDTSAFNEKLKELVKSGKLSKEDAAKLAATMEAKGKEKTNSSKPEKVDWDSEYEKLMANPAVRQQIEKKGATKQEVIEFLKKNAAAKTGKAEGQKNAKPGARKGSFKFYSLVIGRLKSKDIELGEMEIEVDYVISERQRLNAELVGKRVKLVGVSGKFRDALLPIKRGETIKVRTGDYNPETKVLGFGFKFHVLERTEPFNPGDFGVPPEEFRGFSGELTGKVVEAAGYEVLLEVQTSQPAKGSKAKDAKSIVGKRIRIAGFYNQHSEAFADLQQNDRIRLSATHHNVKSDSLGVTDVLKKLKK